MILWCYDSMALWELFFCLKKLYPRKFLNTYSCRCNLPDIFPYFGLKGIIKWSSLFCYFAIQVPVFKKRLHLIVFFLLEHT